MINMRSWGVSDFINLLDLTWHFKQSFATLSVSII